MPAARSSSAGSAPKGARNAPRRLSRQEAEGSTAVRRRKAVTSPIHAAVTVLLGPRFPKVFRTIYEPKFFDSRLSVSDKITEWRTQPAASLQLMTTVLMLSVAALAAASMG